MDQKLKINESDNNIDKEKNTIERVDEKIKQLGL